jgi:histidinol dehydrogenase
MKIYQYPSPEADERLGRITGRRIDFRPEDLGVVQQILDAVQQRGDAAVIEYARRFDAPDLEADQMRVSDLEIAEARQAVTPAFLAALERAANQIAAFHRQQRRRSWIDIQRPGALLGQLVSPVDAAGVYVPGGQGGSTPLVSSVLMGAIPARIAGVARIAMTTPPRKDGTVSPHLLAAAAQAGVSEIYKLGSAWAIGALAFGTDRIPKVDVIVGPGNIYVTLAKKLVAGQVGIDTIAGPSEILIVADGGANPSHLAADLLSQAEHDAIASAVLITDSAKIADATAQALGAQLPTLSRREIAAASIADYGAIFIVPDIATAVDLANRVAPEHLELQVRNPMELLGEIRHAGAVFLGPTTPEAVGDYVAGPNHVLPTAGAARHSSALSVDNFVKMTSVIQYSRDAFDREAEDIIHLAEVEGLDAHAQSVRLRR